MKKISSHILWSINLWISYLPLALILALTNKESFFAFSIGTLGAQFSLLIMIEDVEKLKRKGKKILRIGFYKRYALSAIVLGFSSIFGVRGLIFAFFGLELTRLTLTTFLGSGEL